MQLLEWANTPLWGKEEKALDVSIFEPWKWWGSSAGVNVNYDTALELATVLACTRVISEDVAKYPLNLKRRGNNGTTLAMDSPLFNLLKHRPNSWQTSFEWRECMTLHAVLTGNAYSLIIRDNRRRPISLRPLMPEWVTVEPDDKGRPQYTIKTKDVAEQFSVPADNMFHLRGPSWDTVVGMDATRKARNAIGLSIATEKSQAKLHQNAVRPSGVLTSPAPLGEEALKRLQRQWEHDHTGVQNNFSTIVLDNGITFAPTSMTGVDAQHIETRDHQIEEVARAFKVFPQMVGHSDKTATYASAEAFFSAHHEYTMVPWLVRWEQTLDRDLLDLDGPLFVEFDTRRIQKASTKDRGEYYRTAVELGIYTRNEIRELEGLDPLPGLDEPLTPMNMGTGDET